MTEGAPALGIFTTDHALRVTSWNDALARLSGIPADAANGRALTALIPDLAARGLLKAFEEVLKEGHVKILSSAFHHYLIPCPPREPSSHFDTMRQHVTLTPLRTTEQILGLLVTVEDVTAHLDMDQDLAQGLKDRPADVRAALKTADWRRRKTAVDGLTRLGGKDVVAVLLKAIKEEHHDPSLLNSALDALQVIGVDCVQPLREFLKSPDADLRIYATLALTHQHQPEATAALIEALDDENANVRFHAIEALGTRKAAEARDRLVMIARSGDFFLAFPALEALSGIADATVVAPLLPLLKDPMLRPAALQLVSELADAGVIAELAGFLDDAASDEVIQALLRIRERYQRLYGEGRHITDQIQRALSEPAVQRLLAALETAEGPALAAAVQLLCGLRRDDVQRALIRVLGRTAARQDVLDVFVENKESLAQLVIDHLQSENADGQRDAVLALGRMGSAKAVPALIPLLAENSDLLIPIIGALGKIGDHAAYEPMLALLNNPNAGVRQAAIGALNSLGHPDLARRAATLFSHPDPLMRESATRIVGYFGNPELFDGFLALLADGDERVRRAAIEHLPFFDDARVAPALNQALAAGSPAVRAAVARALAQVPPAVAAPGLLAALEDQDHWVQYYAIRALGHQAITDAIDPLCRIVKTDTASVQVRVAALDALGDIGGARAAACVAPLIAHPIDDISAAAFKALGRISHPDALMPIMNALQAPEARVRRDASQALALSANPEAVAALVAHLKREKNGEVLRACIDALGRMKQDEGLRALSEFTVHPAQREACITALAGSGDAALPALRGALAHADTRVRLAAVETLSRMKRPDASQLLLAARADAHAEIRAAAQTALKELGTLLRKAD